MSNLVLNLYGRKFRTPSQVEQREELTFKLYDQYLKGTPVYLLAAEVNCSASTVYRLFKKHNLPIVRSLPKIGWQNPLLKTYSGFSTALKVARSWGEAERIFKAPKNLIKKFCRFYCVRPDFRIRSSNNLTNLLITPLLQYKEQYFNVDTIGYQNPKWRSPIVSTAQMQFENTYDINIPHGNIVLCSMPSLSSPFNLANISVILTNKDFSMFKQAKKVLETLPKELKIVREKSSLFLYEEVLNKSRFLLKQLEE